MLFFIRNTVAFNLMCLPVKKLSKQRHPRNKLNWTINNRVKIIRLIWMLKRTISIRTRITCLWRMYLKRRRVSNSSWPTPQIQSVSSLLIKIPLSKLLLNLHLRETQAILKVKSWKTVNWHRHNNHLINFKWIRMSSWRWSRQSQIPKASGFSGQARLRTSNSL